MKWHLFICFNTIIFLMSTVVVNAVLPCSNVKFAYTAKGFDDDDVPPAAISGKIIQWFVLILSFIFVSIITYSLNIRAKYIIVTFICFIECFSLLIAYYFLSVSSVIFKHWEICIRISVYIIKFPNFKAHIDFDSERSFCP